MMVFEVWQLRVLVTEAGVSHILPLAFNKVPVWLETKVAKSYKNAAIMLD